MTTTSNELRPDEDVPRPLRKDAARNREALVQAARLVFAERGLDASLDDIAREAGVGVGTAYRHFANKYELAKAIFAQAVDQVVALAERCSEVDDAWAGLVSFLEGVAEMQAVDRGLREVLMGVHDEQQMDRVSDRISLAMRALVERGKEQGSLRADAEVSDVGIVLTLLCTVADLAGDVAPDLWRRYQPTLLTVLQPGPALPVPPLSEDLLQVAMKSHKQRLQRVGQHNAR